MSADRTAPSLAPDPKLSGEAIAVFAFDIGPTVEEAEFQPLLPFADQRMTHFDGSGERGVYELRDRPLVFSFTRPEFRFDGSRTKPEVVLKLFPIAGAVSVSYRISFDCPFPELIKLSAELYRSEALAKAAREEVVQFVRTRLTRSESHISARTEDYFIFRLAQDPERKVDFFFSTNTCSIAQLLRGEPEELASEQCSDAVSRKASYHPCDLTIIDPGATLLIGPELEYVVEVLEVANLELLLMQVLKDRLDSCLAEANREVQRERGAFNRLLFGISGELSRIRHLYCEFAWQYEAFDNPLGLFGGDEYYARIYQLAQGAFGLDSLDREMERKLELLGEIHGSLTSEVSHHRGQFLEIVVVFLIFFEIVMAFLRH